jgi:hypothetical protein
VSSQSYAASEYPTAANLPSGSLIASCATWSYEPPAVANVTAPGTFPVTANLIAITSIPFLLSASAFGSCVQLFAVMLLSSTPLFTITTYPPVVSYTQNKS